jgi:hypothetical protein
MIRGSLVYATLTGSGTPQTWRLRRQRMNAQRTLLMYVKQIMLFPEMDIQFAYMYEASRSCLFEDFLLFVMRNAPN